MTTRELIEKLPESVVLKIEAMRKDYKNTAISKDETRREIAGYVIGLRDAGLINENERRLLYCYAVMKHYIVYRESCVDGESRVEVICVSDTEAVALAAYKNQARIEFENADRKGYHVLEEYEKSFFAYNDGEYYTNHIALYLEETEK